MLSLIMSQQHSNMQNKTTKPCFLSLSLPQSSIVTAVNSLFLTQYHHHHHHHGSFRRVVVVPTTTTLVVSCGGRSTPFGECRMVSLVGDDAGWSWDGRSLDATIHTIRNGNEDPDHEASSSSFFSFDHLFRPTGSATNQ